MSVDPNLTKFVEDIFSPLGDIRVRNMFSGGGIYCDGIMFGLISRDIIFLKVDAGSIPAYQAEGSAAFVYVTQSKLVKLQYWRLPDRLLDETDEILDWARRALSVARSQTSKAHPKKVRKRNKIRE